MARWILETKRADFDAIGQKYNIDKVIARIIRNRDIITDEEIESFLYGTEDDMHNPHLLNDIDRAAAMIQDAIAANKRIRVIGDYDVDGVTSTFILCKGLKEAGAIVDYAIPDRITDGYGINISLIEKAANDGIEMIITCDNGIAATEAFDVAREKGITCIVTDHHEVPFIMDGDEKKYVYPDVEAIVNPKRHDSNYPFTGICGAMVAYKLILVLDEIYHYDRDLILELREMAGFGTVCDVMELKDENRILVKLALNDMNNSHNIGIQALRKVCDLEKKPMSGYMLGFVMGPCVNATGRLDSANLSVDLFFSESIEAAIMRASELKRLNDMRKDMTEEGIERAFEMIDSGTMSEDRVLVVYMPGLHESLAGIVAGRVKERYYRPAIVLTDCEDGVKGSGRSIESYDMHMELTKVSDLFTKFGGHKMAAGVSLPGENVEELRKRLNENCTLGEKELSERIMIDVPMPFGYVTERLIDQLNLLEPFGTGNSKPIFAVKNLKFVEAIPMGKTGEMAKFKVTTDGRDRYELVLFRGLDRFRDDLCNSYGQDAWENLLSNRAMSANIQFDVLYYPGINEFRGKRSIQFIMQDFMVSKKG